MYLLCISTAVDPQDKYHSARIPLADWLSDWVVRMLRPDIKRLSKNLKTTPNPYAR